MNKVLQDFNPTAYRDERLKTYLRSGKNPAGGVPGRFG